MDLPVAITPTLDAHAVAAFCVALLCKCHVNSHCDRAVCHTHCRILGGCTIKSHVLATGGEQIEDDHPLYDSTTPLPGLVLQSSPGLGEPASASTPQELVSTSTQPKANLPSAGASSLRGSPSQQPIVLPSLDNCSFV